MAYATQADIEAIYGPSALYMADHDGDGTADAAAVARALDSASAEIDTYLAVQYTLPVPTGLDPLVQLAVDIALYRLAISHAALTDELRQRYEDAVELLKMLAKGMARLPIPADSDGDGEVDDPIGGSAQPILSSGPPRVFTRATMEDL